MRLSSVFAIAGVFVAAGAVCLICARFAVATIEDTSRTAVLNALDKDGLVWSEVNTDGLQVYLAGTAPSEASRFRALSVAGSVVDATRLIDQMLVRESQSFVVPRFSVEILRSESGISLIGLVPATMDREAFVADVTDIASRVDVSDFLEAADYPSPQGWQDAMDFALRSLKHLDRTKISVDAQSVSITAITTSPEEKAKVEATLTRRVPNDLELVLDISAPRPVIAPFTTRFLIDDQGARFDACSADTNAARDRIIAAARAAGMTQEPICIVGLGVPSPSWSQAVSQTIAAVAELGQGTVTFTDGDISLLAVQGTPEAVFDDVIGSLESNLPDVFSLKAVLPDPPEEAVVEELEFTATLSPEGLLQLRGRVATPTDKTMVDTFAMARFSSDGVDMKARVDDTVPENWTYRIVTGLDALSYLTNGILSVTPDSLSVRGATGQSDANAKIAALLSDQLGDGARFSINVRYEESLDPVVTVPTPEECAAMINAVKETQKINFEPGSARLDVAGKQIMDDIAGILRECGQIPLEIGGHTDSQGRETMNQQLSQARAQAILSELRMRRVLTGSITAVGYGESQPIADNETEEGREANRRIEFKLIRPDDATAEGEADTELATSDEASVEQSAEGEAEAEEAETAAETEAKPEEDGAEETKEAEGETSDEQN